MNRTFTSLMNEKFALAGLRLDNDALSRFEVFYSLFRKYNDQFDLSRLKRPEDIIDKHFLDSIYITSIITLPSPLLDIGSGAGFPGIPLKIISPQLEIILAEPRRKRVEFMRMIIKELNLEGIEIYPHLVTGKSFFKVSGIITRALEPAETTYERVKHFLPPGGRLFFLKGPAAADEIKSLEEKAPGNYTIETFTNYTLPGTPHKRSLIVLKNEKASFKKEYAVMKNKDSSTGIEISSPDNPRFKELLRASKGEKIKKHGIVFISGKKIISDVLARNSPAHLNLILFDSYRESEPGFDEIISRFADEGKLLILKKSLFNSLDSTGAGAPIMTAELPPLPEWEPSKTRGLCLLLPFQDPLNIGAAVRSAAAFNVETIVILREGASPYHPKAVRASSGAVFSVPLFRGPSINDIADTAGNLPLVCLDTAGISIKSYRFPADFMLLPGTEGPGLPEKLKREMVSIPVSGKVESLNAAAALSIALYEIKSEDYSPSNSQRQKKL